MAQKEDSEFPILKKLRERIFQIPLLPQDEILPHFATIDSILYPLAIRLAEELPQVRTYFKEIVYKVASGNTLGKNYFNKFDNEDDPAKKEILKKSEMRILYNSFLLLRYHNDPQKFCEVLSHADFMRGVMEEVVETFIKKVENFETLQADLDRSRLAHSIEYLKHEREMTLLMDYFGLKFEDHERIKWLVVEIQSQWEDYLDKREYLISPYYRLVYKLADKHSQPNAYSQTLDNFQNGVGGLIRAYKCYTPSRFAAFSLVAEQWIKQAILLHIKTDVNFIKLPISNWHSFQKLEKIRSALERKSFKEPTTAQIAKEAKMAVDKVKKIYENIKMAKVISLNVPTQNEEEHSDGPSWSLENLVDERDLEAELEVQSEYQTVREVASNFDEEEIIIFSLMSGCLDLVDNSHILPEDMEKERIRQKGVRLGIDITFKE